MTKIRRILDLLHPPAFFPSMVVAVIHFKLSVLVGPHANVVFQRWFDTGEQATGADAVIASVDSFLAKPIPTEFLAGHPSYGLSSAWWVGTMVNSIVWGLLIYACYRLSAGLFKQLKVFKA